MTITQARLAQLEALRAPSTIHTFLGITPEETDSRVHFGQAPEGTPRPVITIDAPELGDANFAGESASAGVDTYHIWVDGSDESHAVEGAEHVWLRLHRQRLPLPGNRTLHGKCEIVTTLPDPVTGGSQCVMMYRYRIMND